MTLLYGALLHCHVGIWPSNGDIRRRIHQIYGEEIVCRDRIRWHRHSLDSCGLEYRSACMDDHSLTARGLFFRNLHNKTVLSVILLLPLQDR